MLVLQRQVDVQHPLTTLGQRESTRTSDAQTALVEGTVHTLNEDLHTEPSSKLFKLNKPVTKGSWDTPTKPFDDIESIEPREPMELRTCMVSDV